MSMRGTAEIQHAHDLLIGVLLQQTTLQLDGHSEATLMEVAATLCWVLDDDDRGHFAEDMGRLEGELARRGETRPDARRSGPGAHPNPGGSMSTS